MNLLYTNGKLPYFQAINVNKKIISVFAALSDDIAVCMSCEMRLLNQKCILFKEFETKLF